MTESSPTTEAERPDTPAGLQLWHSLVMMVRAIQKDELAHDIRLIEQQARDKGRREAVRVLHEWFGHEGEGSPVWTHVDPRTKRRFYAIDVAEVHRTLDEWLARVAGLNASESPPTLPCLLAKDKGDECPTFAEPMSEWCHNCRVNAGDARESPSTASCCGHFPHGNGPCHGMVTDWGGKRIPCDCDGQDASESGQPPDPEMTEANRESDADAWNSDR